MSARAGTLAVAACVFALAIAPDLAPATPLYHTWQYALALTLGLVAIGWYCAGARRGRDGAIGRRLLVTMAGAAVAGVGGLASGLLGPDTATLTGTPGTVVPVPALGAAAFFDPADAAAIASGNAGVTLRRRNRRDVIVTPGSRKLVGESLLALESHPAAYVEAFDEHGAHLTVTQPANASFLSPVLLFRGHQRILGFDTPFETFATPARHRIVRALYFTPQQLATFAHGGAAIDTTRPGVILTASDDAGASAGTTIAASGQTVALGGIRVRVALGSYPALTIASAPPPWTLLLGAVLFAGGLVWSAVPARQRP